MMEGWLLWTRHTLRISVSLCGASFMATIPISVAAVVFKLIDNGMVSGLVGIAALVVALPAFGYFFTLFYTASPWALWAKRDLEERR